MGDIEPAGSQRMKHLGTAFWLGVLGVALIAIVGGFAGGRAMQPVGAASLPEEGPTIATRAPASVMPPGSGQSGLSGLPRALHGTRAGEGWFDPPEPPLGDAIATRPRGSAPRRTPDLRETVRLAIVIRGIGEDRTMDARFADLPYRLTFAVSAADEIGSLAVDHRSTLIDADPPASVEKIVGALQRLDAAGVLTAATGSSTPAHPLVDRLSAYGTLVVDGMAGDSAAVYRAARAAHESALTRDVLIDQRNEESYVAFMIRQAAHLARRTGSALALGRADPHTYDALRRTLPLLENDGVEVVPATDLIR